MFVDRDLRQKPWTIAWQHLPDAKVAQNSRYAALQYFGKLSNVNPDLRWNVNTTTTLCTRFAFKT